MSRRQIDLAPLRDRWSALAPRERQLVALAGAVLVLAAVWLVGVQPAWRTLRSAPVESARLDAQWLLMQSQAAEAKALRAAPPLAPGLAAQALQSATARLGDAGRLTLQGDRAVLTLSGVDSESLLSWLDEARRGARARPVQAQLQRHDNGYSGTLIVQVGGRS